MKRWLLLLIPLALCSCATTADRHGFFPTGMSDEGQGRNNTKYNLMDSPDGRQDPNGRIHVWGGTY
jgi:hypothetical protein